jgi:Protein of unknown function (DUF3892)
MIFINAIRVSHGVQHEHIVELQWRNPETNQTGRSSREVIVDWIGKGGVAKVADAFRTVDVAVVNAIPPYVRTHADGRWTDNLLALPRY